jgi:hypothetical protein
MFISGGTPTAARAQAIGATPSPTSANGAFVVVPEMSLTMELTRPEVTVDFGGTIEALSLDNWDIALFLDGAEVPGTRRNVNFFGGTLLGFVPAQLSGLPIYIQALLTGIAPGAHTIDVRWRRNVGEARMVGTQRSLFAMEIL